MLKPASLATSFGLGVLLRARALRIRPRHPQLPLSVAAPGPALVTALSLAVAAQHPNLGEFGYATVSVFERESPENTVHLYTARGAARGAICLDRDNPSGPGGTAARLLAEMSLPHVGVLVIPLGSH
ncbi:hypothetical protein [Streptomyces californicus]|uniref:hypothetical protein n=1 Tax=Streptomyces californicus TaxID=67351 RepID=UPI0033EBFE54